MKLANVLIVYTKSSTKEQKSTLDIVKNTLKKYKIDCKLANRDRVKKVDFQNKDLIIAVGGDGTFLRTAHFINNQLLFGVNSDIKNKEGFFMKSDKNNFEKKLIGVMKNRIKIKRLPRLEAYINNTKIDTLALNEFFIGAQKSYHAAKYIIEVDGKPTKTKGFRGTSKIKDFAVQKIQKFSRTKNAKRFLVKERHKSSGILITTPAGSHAWAKSCCNSPLPLNSKNYQFVVREPYEGNVFKNYKLKYCVLRKNQKISIISEMLDGIVIADSVSKEYGFKNGSKATIGLSNNGLNVLWE